MERPKIPAEMERQILVEAGHRCSIHTCRQVGVEIHHIVPWSTVKEHRYENLIALCPNCHQLADRGAIDRQALAQYKARVKALFSGVVGPDAARLDSYAASPEGTAAWLTHRFQEAQTEPFESRIDAEYPALHGPGKTIATINELERGRALAHVVWFRSTARLLWERFHDQKDERGLDWFHFRAYKVTLSDRRFISVRYGVSDFLGGAHESLETEVANYMRSPLVSLGIDDLFESTKDSLALLSDYCRREILNQKEGPTDDEWVVRGTAPEPDNFRKFNLTPYGLLFTFDPYQVDCFSEGHYRVHVPSSIVRSHLLPFVGEQLAGTWE